MNIRNNTRYLTQYLGHMTLAHVKLGDSIIIVLDIMTEYF